MFLMLKFHDYQFDINLIYLIIYIIYLKNLFKYNLCLVIRKTVQKW
jgi:hypothetical protein